MSLLAADLGIWTLLFIGTVFCGFGLMGLLIFPDTKSRMFTAFRATAIGLGAVFLAVLLYGFTLLQTNRGDQYLAQKEQPESADQQPAVSEPGTKDTG
jgi:multisubunit Na+/H+ antiporter MnhG subunit